MLVSVFNWKTLDYDYYETPEAPDYGGWYELQGLGLGAKSTGEGVGIDIEDALPSLPGNAVFAGTGPIARGRLCIRRDSKNRGEGRAAMGAYFPSSRLVNLQTLPEPLRFKYHQDWEQKQLDYSGANLLSVPPRQGFNALEGYSSENVDRPAGYSSPAMGSSTVDAAAQKEIPLAMFVIPLLSGALAGYFAASRTEGMTASKWISALGFIGGVGAGIALGREYEGYKISTIQAAAAQEKQLSVLPGTESPKTPPPIPNT